MKTKTKVRWTSARGSRTGTGRIVEVRQGARGAWYVVKDDTTGETIALRAACIQAL